MTIERFTPFVIWGESVVASYVGVLLVALHDCDKRVDPLAANPFEPALLFGTDLVAAAVYGSILAVVVYGLSILLTKTRVPIARLVLGLVYFAPPAIISIVVILVYAAGPSAMPGCRP